MQTSVAWGVCAIAARALGPEVRWLQSYVTGDKIYCVYIAPDEQAVRGHARRGDFPPTGCLAS